MVSHDVAFDDIHVPLTVSCEKVLRNASDCDELMNDVPTGLSHYEQCQLVAGFYGRLF